MKPQIVFPNRNLAGENETLQCEDNIVIVGANGAGKSRLGSWIEYHQPSGIFVHRISAQRALLIPENATTRNLKQAEKGLFFGNEGDNISVGHKLAQRWGGDAAIGFLNDYEKLLSTLFAKAANRDREHTKETAEKKIYIEVPKSPMDIIEEVWTDIMPHRKIAFDNGKVLASKDKQSSYHGKNMSDGERVALYLLGQCLCAPENAIVIVDEPEIHLHKSIMTRLWNKVEELCPNKLVVYITHDLDFVASRNGAKKIWVKEFGGTDDWIWEEVPQIEGLPESLICEIVGNRKNIIFTEGEKNSFDTTLFQAIYHSFHIIPRGGCEKVIEATKAIQAIPSLHHLSVSGIIDSDFRTTEEIDALSKKKIYTINFAEIENLLCIDPLLEIVAINQALKPDEVLPQVHSFVLKNLEEEFHTQVASSAENHVLFRLNSFVKTENSEKGITDGINRLMASIDVPALYVKETAKYKAILDNKDYSGTLRYYNRKSLAKRISSFFKLKNDEYTALILRLLKTDKKAEIVAAISPYLPTII